MRIILAAGMLVLATAGEARAAETADAPAKPAPVINLSANARLTVDTVDLVDSSPYQPDDVFDLSSARFGAAADIGRAWQVRADYEFALSSRGWRNAFVQYRPTPGLSLRLGNQNTGLGLDEATPDSASSFMERSTSVALAPGRVTGLQIDKWTDRQTLRFGVYGNRELDELPDRRGTRGHSVLGRAVLRPRGTIENAYAVGASLEYRDVSGGRFRTRARSESDMFLFGGVETGLLLDVDHLVAAGVEAQWNPGPLLFAGEYLTLGVHRALHSSLRHNGWNALASWIVTGNRRTYRNNSAAFINVQAEWPGALELGARVSQVDFDPSAGNGGRQTNAALAVDWYPRTSMQVKLELARLFVHPWGAPSDAANVVQLRVQADFNTVAPD